MALNFDDFQKVLETAQQSDAIKTDLKRALKKVTSALENLQDSLNEMSTVLADDYTPAGRKPRTARAPKADNADGTDASGAERKRPGRPKKVAA